MLKIPKKWRELSLHEKLDLPVKYFKFEKEQIEKIRDIKDKREKLIASGKIQFDKFGDIHTFLLSWIAGYGSDVEVRHVFGSTQNFRDLFFKKIKLPYDIKPSWMDIKRKIKIPDKMKKELAEETGIHIGDGNLYVYYDKNKFPYYQYSISGNLKDEEIYHLTHIGPLIRRLYNLSPNILKRTNRNSIDTRFRSKAIISFKNKVLGLVIGSKKDIKIPQIIMENNEFSKSCLVGIFDTDFHITEHLAISGKLHSLNVCNQIHEILERNKIKHVYTKYEHYGRFYIPKDFSKIIVRDWGMHNLKHLTKFEIFEKFGKLIPFTTTTERISLLKGVISLVELESISRMRKLKNR
ncbi:MAG: hypothetical protein AABX94_02520 [Nanoarchaeota archaeon]